jgi:uncharacterized protein YndB with AHSA1/START domain
MNSTDRVVVTTIVDADPKAAFQIFVEDVDSWWKRGLRYRPTAAEGGQMRFEPGTGGRLLETYKSNDGPFEIGRILVWEPGVRLVFDWRSPEFGPDEKTVVEVHFEPAGEGARVTVEHRGWDGIPAEHPLRHGWTGGAFASMIGLRWADQLTALRQRIHANFAGAPGSR